MVRLKNLFSYKHPLLDIVQNCNSSNIVKATDLYEESKDEANYVYDENADVVGVQPHFKINSGKVVHAGGMSAKNNS